MPNMTVESLHHSVMALKELVEMLAGQRGDPRDVAVRWSDLLALHIVEPADVPKDIGSVNLQQTRNW